ncbi:hypothetical protein F5Y19DRAFT_308150 [Xylariaceae sp. FL1651]|nr:hypothetical protein F5Y19DRAFT_308150 [Xylariaceae sp. FL1651]
MLCLVLNPTVLVPSEPVDGAIPATASHTPSPHPTYEEAQLGQAITGEQAAVPHSNPKVHDTSAVSTASTTLPGGLSASTSNMLFSGLYKSTKSPLSRLRQNSQPVPGPVSREYDPDLVSKDKNKQKEAVRRFLAARIRNDWVFKWPPVSDTKDLEEKAPEDPVTQKTLPTQEFASDQVDKVDVSACNGNDEGYHGEDDVASIYSTVSEDPAHFCPRAEWLSGWSDDEDDEPASPSAYRFENPETIGSAIKATEITRSAKRRRAVRAEMEWNSGLACFNARRDAWTGAKVARVRPKATASSTTSPTTRRLSFWRLSGSTSPSSPTESIMGTTPLSPSATRTSGDTSAVTSVDSESKESKVKEDSSRYPVQTLLPVPPPLLPAANPMRASITPASYSAIYDKIVLHALTPACPVNLGDVLRACVVGWKRDGEWPPRPMEAPPVVAVRKKKRKDSNGDNRSSVGRRLSFNFLGRRLSASGDPSAVSASPSSPKEDDANTAKGVKRSLQRVFGIGQDRTNGIAP